MGDAHLRMHAKASQQNGRASKGVIVTGSYSVLIGFIGRLKLFSSCSR
jgi:hypothetical protein